jgi:hypothetical protein
MATLTVEDGSVVENANSYVTLEDCTAYHASLGNEDWEDVDGQEEAILRAMAWLETQPWKGQKTDYDNPLQWPRSYVTLDGLEVPDDEVPTAVVRALCEAALIEGETPGALRPALDRGGQVTSFSLAGVMSETYASGAPAGTTYPAITGKLRGLTYGSGNIKVELA